MITKMLAARVCPIACVVLTSCGAERRAAAASARHDLVHSGPEPLQLAAAYAPPNHLDGRVHNSRADAETNAADDAFGGAVR